jgi:DNA-binding XRE family transcriptional regulator
VNTKNLLARGPRDNASTVTSASATSAPMSASTMPAPGSEPAVKPASAPAAAKAVQQVTLFTDRSLFAQQWSQALGSLGVEVSAARPSQLPRTLERGQAVVIDAGSEVYEDDDELLSHVGLARALGAVPVVSVPTTADVSSIDDILDDLCEGLVARRPEDVERVAWALARRTDANRSNRFEYLTVSPRGGELLAIFSDGSAALVDRPVVPEDDGSNVEEIVLDEQETRAVLTLATDKQFTVTSAFVAQKSLLRRAYTAQSADVDGVKLGKRIRELRLAAGLTQAELARRTGIHRPNIARVEAGRHTPSLETLARLAQAIGVPTTRVLDV